MLAAGTWLPPPIMGAVPRELSSLNLSTSYVPHPTPTPTSRTRFLCLPPSLSSLRKRILWSCLDTTEGSHSLGVSIPDALEQGCPGPNDVLLLK